MTVVASNYERSKNDLYQTEAWATQALLRHFPVSGLHVWEPAAGNHKMADVLRDAGAIVTTSDIQTYDRPHDAIVDFRDRLIHCPHHQAIITNPPYGIQNRLAVKFCELALERCDGLVAMLLTAKFDFGNTRPHLFRDNKRFAAKIALLDRIQWFAGQTKGTEDHAWYIWTAAHNAYPRLIWEGKEHG